MKPTQIMLTALITLVLLVLFSFSPQPVLQGFTQVDHQSNYHTNLHITIRDWRTKGWRVKEAITTCNENGCNPNYSGGCNVDCTTTLIFEK